MAIEKYEAGEILSRSHIERGVDFHTLSSTQVESLGYFADLHKYRAPKVRNGSRLRYFHEMLQRKAARKA
jgi:hypothetical protein